MNIPQPSKAGSAVSYRQAVLSDVAASAKLRAISWGTEEYWRERIAGYLNGTLHPRGALGARIIYVAEMDTAAVGLVAGHLSTRLACQGELEWIDVAPEQRRRGIASQLARLLATWFVEQEALRICVDPGNAPARTFYRTLAAQDLNAHWMFWPDIRVVALKSTILRGQPEDRF
jgi:ribosomal protein S18 acetylase RimI-like enzyme